MRPHLKRCHKRCRWVWISFQEQFLRAASTRCIGLRVSVGELNSPASPVRPPVRHVQGLELDVRATDIKHIVNERTNIGTDNLTFAQNDIGAARLPAL